MAVRTRRSVYSLSPTGPELDWYRRAVEALDALPLNNPASWKFLAACHGIPGSVVAPPAAKDLWRECQHQTWFFLSWHRAYLVGFEAIIAAKIEELGGPSDWALPYWDYSNTANPVARELPPAFRDRFLPSGQKNWLWAPRIAPTPPQTVLTLSTVAVSLAAMAEPDFTNNPGSMSSGFGGPQIGMSNGVLENRPHNAVHGGIGGYMGNTTTAALDPIFWLHHCNIDRLWEVWRGAKTPVRDPHQSAWLTGVTFKLPDANGGSFKFQSKQALDTTTLRHGYRYDTVNPVKPSMLGGPLVAGTKPAKPPKGPKAGPFAMTMIKSKIEIAAGQMERKSELVGANSKKITLGAEKAESEVRIKSVPDKVMTFGLEHNVSVPSRYFLSIENVTASGQARDYKIFLDLPDDNRVPIDVGLLATFGVSVASDTKSEHGGNGLRQVFDVTNAVNELGIGAKTLSRLRVTFEPLPTGKVEDYPPDTPYADILRQPPAQLKVGKINLYAE